MTYFLVNRRLKEGDRIYEAGVVTQDFDPADKTTDILITRGLITPVPEDFAAARATAVLPSSPEVEATAAESNTDDGTDPDAGADDGTTDADDAGEDEDGDDSTDDEDDEVTLEDLLELTRAQLNEQAIEAGIEDPESLPNKQAVAEAILAKLAE